MGSRPLVRPIILLTIRCHQAYLLVISAWISQAGPLDHADHNLGLTADVARCTLNSVQELKSWAFKNGGHGKKKISARRSSMRRGRCSSKKGMSASPSEKSPKRSNTRPVRSDRKSTRLNS